MKSIKEKQFLVNMAIALGQTPDPALVREIEEHKKLMEAITPTPDDVTALFAQLAQLKDDVESIKNTVEVKQQYFPEEFPKPPSLDDLMAMMPPEEEPVVEEKSVVEETEVVNEGVTEESVTNPLVDAAAKFITKEIQIEGKSFQQPEPTDPVLKSIEDIKKKIKFLEGWIAKISLDGPGSGEVNLLKLDDVDTSSIGDNKFLKYNAANNKIEFATVSGGTSIESTTDLPEGANLYFTNARAVGAFTAGDNVDIDANGLISVSVTGGGSVDLTAVEGNIVPVTDSLQNLGSVDKRWGTLYLANNTIDLGGALIKSDGTGQIVISSAGAILPVNSKIEVDGEDKNIAIVGNTGAVTTIVPFYTKRTGLNTVAAKFTFGANPDDYVFTNFLFKNGSTITQSSRAQFYF